MKYYLPQLNDEVSSVKNSGAYIFLPQYDDSTKKPYSKFYGYQVFKSERTGVEQMVVYFYKKNSLARQVIDNLSKFYFSADLSS